VVLLSFSVFVALLRGEKNFLLLGRTGKGYQEIKNFMLISKKKLVFVTKCPPPPPSPQKVKIKKPN
jgi:hypothetical protein